MKFTMHYALERQNRFQYIKEHIGFGKIRDEFEVDNNHPNGVEIHKITSTAIVLVFNKRTEKLVTVFVAKPNRIKRYYMSVGREAPQDIIDKAIENRDKGYQKEAQELH